MTSALRNSLHKADGSSKYYNYKPSQDVNVMYPPKPVDRECIKEATHGAASALTPYMCEDGVCAVCAQLIPSRMLSRLGEVRNALQVLAVPNVVRQERVTFKDTERYLDRPIILSGIHTICEPCRASVRDNKIPRHLLANNLWIGKVPNVLSSLNWIEQMLVARVRHNACFVKVNGGYGKQVANCVSYEIPIPRIYNVLPPAKGDIEDVIAIFFTGPKAPTLEEWKKLPLLVRPAIVLKALNWLRLNNVDYEDIEISRANLSTYPLNEPPVGIFYKPTSSDADSYATVDPEVHGMSMDVDPPESANNDPIPFVVHGLIGSQLE
ncbi:hypothetical protein CYLTODRAFT_363388, partial [Cylindrobasidium torrendii FP15055 ss-10]